MKIRALFFLFFIGSIVFPLELSAATCNICNRETSGDYCFRCSYRIVRTSRSPGISDLYKIDVFNEPPKSAFKRAFKATRKLGPLALVVAILFAGVALFFWSPTFGVIVIIIALLCAYANFAEEEKKRKTRARWAEKLAEKRANSSMSNTSESLNEEGNDIQNSCELTEKQSSVVEEKIVSTSPVPECASENNVGAKTIEEKNNSQLQFSVTNDLNELDGGMEKDHIYWCEEGRLYCSGADGRAIDYQKAKECFEKARQLGNEEAKNWCDSLTKLVINSSAK